MMHQRPDQRAATAMRPIRITYDAYGYADASVLFELGNTKVLCGVTLQAGVPNFLKGQRTGWLTAEYAMLPSATHQRTQRETSQAQRNARSIEISRLIGRCLRPTIDLTSIGERQIVIDCDVIQADGSTRCAAVTAASIALKLAAQRWVANGILHKNVHLMSIAGVSAGVIAGYACVDITYTEDSSADADFNFIMNEAGSILEIQGTAEKTPVPWDMFEQLRMVATAGVSDIFAQVALQPLPTEHPPFQNTAHSFKQSNNNQPGQQPNHEKKSGMFNLGNRTGK